MTHKHRLKSPPGASDIYGKDCLLKSRTEQAITSVFRGFGYNEIQTPAFEYLEVFGDDMSIPTDEAIKFIDTSGKVLALRPDFTTSISRAVASHLSEAPLPLRLWYLGNVYRSGESYKSAKKTEFAQAGVELIGVNTPRADAEVISLTVNALLKSGLTDFQLELSHSEFLQGIIDSCNLSLSDEDTLRSLLDKKFAIGIEDFCASRNITGVNYSILTELSLYFGDGEDILSRYRTYPLNPVSKNALNELYEVYSILKELGLDKYVNLDLGQVRSFKYYTGVIFRGITTSSAFPICGGGRYNTLGRRFDLDLPATGVAIWVDRLADAILRASDPHLDISPDVIIFSSDEHIGEAYKLAEDLRRKGKKVILDVCSLSEEDAQKSAQERNITEIYYL